MAPILSGAGSQLETRVTALLKKLQTANQQPLTFGGRGRSGRAPSARTPARGSSADGAMPPKKRGSYSHAHAGGGDATDRMRSHSEASTPSKKCAHPECPAAADVSVTRHILNELDQRLTYCHCSATAYC